MITILPLPGEPDISCARGENDHVGIAHDYTLKVLGAPTQSVGEDGTVMTIRHPLTDSVTALHFGVDGVSDLSLLAILIDRLSSRHGATPCVEFESAAKHVVAARDMLLRRAGKRARKAPSLPAGARQETIDTSDASIL